MALTLNTGHPLFGNLKSFICVEGGVIKDLVQPSRVFTPHVAVTYGTNAYGEFFKTLQVSNNAQGVGFTPGMETCGSAQKTIISVHTDATAAGAALAVRGSNSGSTSAISPGTFWTGVTIVAKNRMAGAWGGAVQGTIPLPSMVGFTRTGETSSGLIENGSLTAQSQLYYNGSRPSTYIGGDTTGAYGGCLAANHNYIIEFDVALDAAQVSDLYTSLGASGAISLLSTAPSGVSTTFSASTADAVFSGAAQVAVAPASATFVVVSADVVFSGSASVSVPAVAVFSVTTDSPTFNIVAIVAASGSFVSDVLINNTGTVLASQAVYWSWLPSGRIGSLASVTEVDGTGTTNASGILTATGLSPGAGILLIAKRNTSAVDDHVYYQAGTVT